MRIFVIQGESTCVFLYLEQRVVSMVFDDSMAFWGRFFATTVFVFSGRVVHIRHAR